MTQLGWADGRLRSFEEQSAFSSASPSQALPEIRVWVAINFEIAWDLNSSYYWFFFIFWVCLHWKQGGCCRSAFSLSCKWTSHPWGYGVGLFCLKDIFAPKPCCCCTCSNPSSHPTCRQLGPVLKSPWYLVLVMVRLQKTFTIPIEKKTCMCEGDKRHNRYHPW